MYIAQTDIESNWGATNVAQWASYTPTTNPAVVGAATTRIAMAINVAEAFVNSRMSMSVYAVPVVGLSPGPAIPYEITNMCAELAGIWLWRTRSLKQSSTTQQQTAMREKAVHQMLTQIIVGTYPLAAVHRGRASNTPFVAFGGCR